MFVCSLRGRGYWYVSPSNPAVAHIHHHRQSLDCSNHKPRLTAGTLCNTCGYFYRRHGRLNHKRKQVMVGSVSAPAGTQGDEEEEEEEEATQQSSDQILDRVPTL